MTVQVDGDSAILGLQRLKAAIAQAATRALQAAVKATEDSERSSPLYKDRSGGTRSHIKASMTSPYSGMVVAGGASRFLENGTRPHIIMGRNGGMLRFQVNGVVLFRRMVRHPGTKPRPTVAIAQRIGEQALVYGAEYYVSEAIRHA